MPLQLPPPPQDPRVPLPEAPAHPPTHADLYEARKYTKNIFLSKSSANPNRATVDDVGHAIVYEHSVAQIASAAAMGPAVAPPWFAPVQQQLDDMQQQLSQIDAKTTRALNATSGDGTNHPFEVVLFADGSNPIAPPHNLPALTSVAIINGLQGAQVTSYLNGYGILVPRLIADRIHLLKAYLGYREP